MDRVRDIECHSAIKRDFFSLMLNHPRSISTPSSNVAQSCRCRVKKVMAVRFNIINIALSFSRTVASDMSAINPYNLQMFSRSLSYKEENRIWL